MLESTDSPVVPELPEYVWFSRSGLMGTGCAGESPVSRLDALVFGGHLPLLGVTVKARPGVNGAKVTTR
jgi:hypothetical protein